MKLKLLTILLVGFSISGCNRSETPEQQKSETQSTNTQSVIECAPLSDQMAKIDTSSQIAQLDEITQQLKDCLPKVDNAQQLKWLEQSTAMYKKFLDTNNNTEAQVISFTDYTASILEDSPEDKIDYTKGDAKLFKTLSARDQYLIQNLGKSYLDLQYFGEGIFQYRRQPSYLIDVFSPHLSEDQAIFLKQMAKDNQKSFLSDGAITIPWSEMVERALFWENYLKQYPKGYFAEDAKILFRSYRYFTFMGTGNTPVSYDFVGEKSIDPQALAEIKKLSQNEDTSLSQQAKAFLEFISMPVEKRNQTIKVDATNEDGDTKHEYELTFDQLEKYLKLPSPWTEQDNGKDCYTDAICFDYE